jgi:hypothetical protein
MGCGIGCRAGYNQNSRENSYSPGMTVPISKKGGRMKKKDMAVSLTIVLVSSMVLAACGGSEGDGGATTQTVTINPAFDFYINRTWNTDTNTLWGYGKDSAGTDISGHTGSATGNSGGINYQNFFKLLYNFNISTLNGSTIQSASFRVYLHSIGGADAPQNAILENIHYGNTNGFPNPRNLDNEYGEYKATPAIAAAADATSIGWKSFDVTAKLQADVNEGRSNSQFRLSHVNAANLLNYNCNWYMADNASNKPELEITYTK